MELLPEADATAPAELKPQTFKKEVPMTTNIMTQASIATLTEKELWHHYLPLTITQTMSFGPTVERFIPDHDLRDPGSYGLIESLSETLADDVAESDTPEETIDLWIVDLESYVNNLKLIRDTFSKLKQVSIIMPADHAIDATEDEIREWERAANAAEENPRYRPPLLGNSQEAA